MDNLKLNVSLLKRRVKNLTKAAQSVGLRPATVSNLCTGKIPVGRAEVRTLAALASLADCTLDELIIRGNEAEMTETGIKVLDLFAPLTVGGTVGFVARPDMGQLVLLAEIFKRMSDQGHTTIFIMPTATGPGIDDVAKVSNHVCSEIKDAYELIKSLDRENNVFLAADRSKVLSGDIFILQEKLEQSDIRNVTTLLVDPRGEAVDEDEPYGPLDTLWQFDAELIARKVYPAINPIYSTSIVLENAHLDTEHLTIQQQARKILRRYRELGYLVQQFGFNRISESDMQVYKRGERLEAYLTQPFYIAEPFTKKNGVSVSLHDTLKDTQKILNGNLDDIDVKKLQYIGKIEDGI